MASEVIPKEQLAAYRRWQVDSFDTKAPPEPAPLVMPQAEPAPLGDAGELVDNVPLPTAEDIERIHEEARSTGYDAGFAEGREAGEAAGREAAEEWLEHLSQLVGNAEQSLAELDQSVAESILELALAVAGQVARSAIKVKADFMLPVIREAIALLPLHHGHIAVHLNPEDADKVRPLLGDSTGQNELRIIEDNTLSPGGCRLQAGASEIDASIETRWQRVVETIGSEPQAWLNQP